MTIASFISGIVLITSLLLLIISLASSSSTSQHHFATTSNTVIKRIKILLISDIHANKSNVIKVYDYIQKSNTNIDHLWMSGDFLSLPSEDQEDQTKVQQAEDDVIDLLSQIKKIHPNPVFIPGNHDPKTLFATDVYKYLNFAECINIHNQIYQVKGETNLFMAGFGGAVPAILQTEVVWDGYPFVNEEAYGEEYDALMQRIIDNNTIKTANSVVLFTHNGPSMCTSTVDWSLRDQNKIITSGSRHVMNSLLDEQLSDKIFLNVHGHTHLAFGQGHIGSVRIVNPGSLMGHDQGTNFALLELVQKVDETWEVDSVVFQNLATVKHA